MVDALKKLFAILPDSDRWKFGALFILMMISTGLEVAGIGMIPVFISAISDPGMVLSHNWLGPIASNIGIDSGRDLFLYGGVSLICIFLVKGCYLIWMTYIKSKFIFNRFAIIATRLFETYLNVPYTFHLERNTAELIRNVTNETRYISNNVMMPFLTILMHGVTIAGIFALLVFIEPWITIITFVVLGGGGGLLLKLLKTKLQRHGQVASKERSRMIQGVSEGIGGFKDVTVMNRQKLFLDRFKGYVQNLTRAEIFKSIASSASKPAIEFVAISGMILIAFAMVWQGRPMGTIIPILGLFGTATVRLMPSVHQVINQVNKLRYFVYALDPVHDDIKNMEEYYHAGRRERGDKVKLSFHDEIYLENIWYRYPNSKEEVLKNVTLSIPKKSAVGFVGPTGAGKSTIVDVILGLLEPHQGKVRVDGIDISEKKRAWQNNVGYIPQFIYLSDDTIKNNIAFGISEEMISERKIKAAIEAAQLEEFINELPDGVETIVGEDGVKLSGGQRQRVGIARALYDNPEVLIMDEGTSSLDNKTEKQVISAIEALKGERTIIMIAHRLTTVQNCDRLFMMKKGEIVNRGTYEELLGKSREFQEMSLVD